MSFVAAVPEERKTMRSLMGPTLSQDQLTELDSIAEKAGSPEVVDFIASISAAIRNGELVLAADSNQLLTPNEAAQRIGMSRTHLCKLLDRNEIPSHRVGTHRRIRLEDLLKFEEQRSADRCELVEKLSASRKVDRAADDVIAEWL